MICLTQYNLKNKLALFTTYNVKFSGISACVPKRMESNFDYELLPEDERKLLIKTTGIEQRRIAEKGVTTSDLCYEAAEKLIKDLNWNKNEIELLVFVSQSRDYFVPSTATILQNRLGLPKSTIAFDSGLGCSGYVYGMSMIVSFMNTSKIRKALLLVGDISSFSLTPLDKSTYPLFSDAGTATAFEFDESANKMDFSLGTDGAGYKAIWIPDGCLRSPYNSHTFDMEEVEKGISRSRGNLWLNGLDVFTFSVTEIPKNIIELMHFTNVDCTSVDYFVMHQANKIMNETIRKKLKIEESKTPYSLRNFGNTSSASIPLTLVTQCALTIGGFEGSKKFLLSGFGVGLSWGSVVFDSEKIFCSSLIEV